MSRLSAEVVSSGFDALIGTATSIHKVTTVLPVPVGDLATSVGTWLADLTSFAAIVKAGFQLPDRERLAQLLFAADGRFEAWEMATAKTRQHYRRMADAVLALINQGDANG